MPLLPEAKNCDPSVKKNFRRISKELGYTAHVTHASITLNHTGIGDQLTLSKTCTLAAGLNVLRVTGLQTDDTALTGTLRGAYIDVSNGSTAATGTIRAMELKARTEAPGYTGNNVAVLEGLSISADSKAHDVTTMRAAEFILDGKTAGTIDEAVGLRIANNLQVDKATLSYGLQIYRDSFDYTYDISLSLGGHITGDSYVNQDLRTTASPVFVGGTFSAVVTGVLPTAGTHLATKEYVDLAGLSGRDYWLSDTDDGVIADYHVMYPAETGDAESTILSDGMTAGDNQLMFSFVTEAGEPGFTQMRPGVYRLHTHLNKGTGDPTTIFYWTLSKRLAADPFTETLLMTSETSGEIDATTPESFETHAALTTGVVIGVTDRLVLKYYGNVTGGGTSEVTITMEGTHDCHLSIQAPSSIWQNQSDALDSITALGAIADNEFIVGTGAGTYAHESGATVRTSLGLAIGTNVQAWDAGLDSLAGLTYAAAAFVKMTGANTFALRTIAETKTDLSLNLVENTALSTWAGSANITTLGTIATGTWQATDVGIAHGGTGQSTAQLAINALTAVGAATNEHVLTKDTGTGNAIWKVAAGGAHTHDGDTLQLDGINSDGGAFSFTTSGDVTFNENIVVSKHMALGGAAIDADIGFLYATEVLTDTDNTAKMGIYSYTQVKKTAAAMTGAAFALNGALFLDSTNTQNWTETQAGLRGFQGVVVTEVGSSGTVTGAACGFLTATVADAATVTNLYGLYINTPTVAGSKVTNEYGLYIKDQNTGATLNYSIYTGAGLVRLGGNVTVGNIAAPAQSSNFHLYKGDSGATAGIGYDVNASMFLENNDHVTALIVTPNNKQGIWGFADGDDTFVAGLVYDHNIDKIWIYSNNGVRFTILSDGGIVIPGIKAGITQAAAGAAANELWRDTDDGNTIKLGV